MRTRRRSAGHADIWPGFVDALSTLLLVIIFLLVVFVLAQFFMCQLLQGKDSRLAELETAVAQLTNQLDLEQASAADLRLSVSRLSADLQAAVADREDAFAELAEVEAERDDTQSRLLLVEDEKARLTQTLNAMRAEVAETAALERELEETVDVRRRLEEELSRIQQTVQADRETIELQLAQLVQLRRDIATLEEVRSDLDLQVAEMAALLEAAELAKEASALEVAKLSEALALAETQTTALEEEARELRGTVARSGDETGSLAEEVTRLTALLEAARGESRRAEAEVRDLRAELDRADDEGAARERRIGELAALLEEARGTREQGELTVEELRQARERLLADLALVRSRSSELEARLASEEERTALAQRELEARDLQIADLLRQAGRTDESLAIEQTLSREAMKQVELLNRQVNALRVQLTALEQTLDAEQRKVEEQQVTIADLGSKLNLALASKVEELSRFRSEFFGRLREVLGDRPDVRIVGDRFVFQSEVLFPSASAAIEPGGREELAKLADSLRTLIREIPDDINWVLQINGHTDRRPIATAEFPSNWELATARATSVAKYLISQGIPPARLAVAGFASFQPIDDRQDEIAYRRNRRIELKLTQR